MGLLTFRGGVHPYDGKELSKDKPTQEVFPKGDCVYPLSQHIGAPALPIVKKGDRVLAGQKIAQAQGFVSASVHSAISGTVKVIEKRRVVTGSMVDSIVIENDGQYEAITMPVKPLEEMSREEVINTIKEAGIVGMGGAGFPAHVKLSPKEPDNIDYIIVNAAECEPYITSDYRRIMENPEKIVEGLAVILSLFPNATGILAVEDNKPEGIRILSERIRNNKRIELKSLKTKYPQGAERQLMYAATGRAIDSSKLPADAGCIVHNVETVVSIYEAVVNGRPSTHKIITITGDAVVHPQNFSVCIGMNYRELIDAAGGFKSDPEKIISGGPMMGFAMFELDVPVIKNSSALLCMTKDEVASYEPSACINCGKCVSICPGRVVPARLAQFAERGQEEEFLEWNGLECCECGCCSYVCPAKRQLTQSIKSMRKILLAKRKK